MFCGNKLVQKLMSFNIKAEICENKEQSTSERSLVFLKNYIMFEKNVFLFV